MNKLVKHSALVAVAFLGFTACGNSEAGDVVKSYSALVSADSEGNISGSEKPCAIADLLETENGVYFCVVGQVEDCNSEDTLDPEESVSSGCESTSPECVINDGSPKGIDLNDTQVSEELENATPVGRFVAEDGRVLEEGCFFDEIPETLEYNTREEQVIPEDTEGGKIAG